jgi:hypothetical protein
MYQYPRNGPEDHLDLVDKMQKSLKLVQKTTSALLKELALEEARKLKIADPQVKKVTSQISRFLSFCGRFDWTLDPQPPGGILGGGRGGEKDGGNERLEVNVVHLMRCFRCERLQSYQLCNSCNWPLATILSKVIRKKKRK